MWLMGGSDAFRWRSAVDMEHDNAMNQARMVATAAAGRGNARRKPSSRQGDRDSLDDVTGVLDDDEDFDDDAIIVSAGGSSHQQRTKQRVELSAIEDEGLETLVKDKRSSWRAGPAKRVRRNRRYEKRILRNLDLDDEFGDGDGWDEAADDWNRSQ